MKEINDIMDKLMPSFLEFKKVIDNYPGAIQLKHDEKGYFVEINLTLLEHLPGV